MHDISCNFISGLSVIDYQENISEAGNRCLFHVEMLNGFSSYSVVLAGGLALLASPELVSSVNSLR